MVWSVIFLREVAAPMGECEECLTRGVDFVIFPFR